MELQGQVREVLEQLNLTGDFLRKSLLSLAVIIIGYLAAYLIIKLINNKIDDYKYRHQGRKYTYYIITFSVIISTVFIWLETSINWSTFFGFLSAGLALAFHQVLLNIAGWGLIVIKRPFDLGDRVEIDGVQGDVIDIQLFHTTLLEVGNWVKGDQSTGRVVSIPNANIFKAALFNYTIGFEYLWNEVSILVTFQSDWQQAKEIAKKIAEQEGEPIQDKARYKIKQMSKKYMIKYGKFTPIVYIEIQESGVQLNLRYLTSVRKRRQIEDNINHELLQQLQANPEIEIAYPSRTVYRYELDKSKMPRRKELQE